MSNIVDTIKHLAALGVARLKTDPLTGKVAGLTDPSGAVIAIPFLTFHASGSIASPVSSTTATTTGGKLGLPQNIAIPANALKAGSKIVGQLKIHHTGTVETTAAVTVCLGTTNSASDQTIASSGTGVASFTPAGLTLKFECEITAVGPTTIYGNSQYFLLNVGSGMSQFTADLTAAQLDVTQIMYINFLFSNGGAGAGTDVYKVIAYDVQVYA